MGTEVMGSDPVAAEMPTEVMGSDPVAAEVPKEEHGPDEEIVSAKYDGHIEAYLAEMYLGILNDKNIDFSSPNIDNTVGEIALLDVLGDGQPELLYIYRHNKTHEKDKDFVYPAFYLKIFSHSILSGTESIFDSIVFEAAGGGGSYCVYITLEGELMLYHSTFSGGSTSWGFWEISPNQNLKTTEEYLAGNYDSNLARLYYASFFNENKDEEKVYKGNGKEISKAQHDIIAEGTMWDIDRVIFHNNGIYSRGLDDLWKNITPFEAEYMTYDEAIGWLEEQIENQKGLAQE